MATAAAAFFAGPVTAQAATPSGGTLVYALSAAIPSTLDPDLNYVKSETQGGPMEAIYGLLAYQNAKTGAVVPVFLKSIKPSNDNKTWTLTLHPNIKFSDGTPLNAAAIAYNIARGADKNSGDTYQSDLAAMHTHVVNATTLRITYPTPNVAVPVLVSQDIPFIASPAAVRKEGTNYSTHPVGAGPFKLSQYIANNQITLSKNSFYSGFAPGEPYYDTLEFQQLSSSQTQVLNAMNAGTAQMTWVQGNTQIKEARSGGSKVDSFAAGGGEWLLFNMSKPPFNNLKARQAVYDALNHQDLANAWTPGIPAMTNLLPKTSPLYNAKYNFPPSNPAKAKQLFQQLDSAGTPVQFTCEILVPYNSVCSYIQSTLQQYPGVKVGVDMTLGSVYLQDQADGNFQATAGGTAYVNPTPVLLNQFYGPQNYSKWTDAAVANAAKKLLATSNPAQEKKLWATVETQFNQQIPFFGSQSNLLGLVYNDSKVAGIVPIEFGTLVRFELVHPKS